MPLHPDAGQRRYPLWNGWGYETAGAGGKNGIGTLFALDAGPPKPAPQPLSFTPRSTAIGKQVRIWGYNLFSAAVQFNGTAETVASNAGSNYVWATVPASATSGPIPATTPGGTSTAAANFTVNQGYLPVSGNPP